MIDVRGHQGKHIFILQAYGKARTEGIDEIGALLLSISSELLVFNFRETFVNAFDVRPPSMFAVAA